MSTGWTSKVELGPNLACLARTHGALTLTLDQDAAGKWIVQHQRRQPASAKRQLPHPRVRHGRHLQRTAGIPAKRIRKTPEMNNLSWLLYLADMAGNLSTAAFLLSCFLGIGLIPVTAIFTGLRFDGNISVRRYAVIMVVAYGAFFSGSW